MKRKSILVLAYACNPSQGSEEAVGWEWANAIAADYDITVLTAAFHANSIAACRDLPRSLRFRFVPHKPWHYSPRGLWKRIESSPAKPIMHTAYAQWLREAYHLAEGLLDRERFDVVHQLTYVGFRFPGHLWKLGLPFVWGPIGGMENVAWSLISELGGRGAAEFAARNVINTAQKRWLHSARQAARVAGPGLIAATSGIAREMNRYWGLDATVMCEVTPPDEQAAEPPQRARGEPLRIAWAGRHLPRKALPLLLKGLSRMSPGHDWQLEVYGEGPMTGAWRAQAQRLGIGDRCTWLGSVPREQVVEGMSRSHVFAISSLQDLTSTVLLEALSQGLPVVCPDHCGFSDVVTDECGVKIPPTDIEALVAGFSRAIQELAQDEPLRYRMGQAALERAREYTWERKRGKLNEIYERTVATHRARSSSA